MRNKKLRCRKLRGRQAKSETIYEYNDINFLVADQKNYSCVKGNLALWTEAEIMLNKNEISLCYMFSQVHFF